MQEQETKVAVWYMGFDYQDDDAFPGEVDRALAVHRAIFKLTGNYELAQTLVYNGKGVIAGPVTCGAAEVIVKWIEAEGGSAHIDNGYYEDNELAEADVPAPRFS